MSIEQYREILNQNNSNKYTIKETRKIYNQLYILTEIIYEIIHFIPQSEFICDKNGKILVDFVGRFENLNDDLNSISRKIKKELSLEHHNKNFKKDYKKTYSKEMKTKVYEVYNRDFVLFNYNFLNNDA